MIYIISGTNRPNALTQKVAKKSVDLFNEVLLKKKLNFKAELLDLADLKLEIFDPKSYGEKPEWFTKNFQEPILNAKGLYVIVPEYNGSFPGVMKYFIDMLKFPESLVDLPIALTGVAAGQFGALRSVEQLELLFQYRKSHIYGERLFVPAIQDKIDEEGAFTDLKDRHVKQVEGFISFVNKLKS